MGAYVLEAKFKEKRTAQRLNIPIKIKYKLFPKKKILVEAFSQNISGSGFKLCLDHPLKKGDRLKSFLYFPGDPKPIAASSEVVWSRSRLVKGKKVFDTGIKYIKIEAGDRDRFVFLFCELMMNFFIVDNVK